MSYFRLYPDCHFIEGPIRSTIHIISKNKTIHLSENNSRILKRLLGKSQIEEVRLELGLEADNLVNDYMNEGFGAIYESPVYSEPYFPNCRFEIRGFFEPAPIMRVAYIQLTSKCNAKCRFCNDVNYYNWQGCNSCIKWAEGGDESDVLDFSKIKKSIDVLIDLNVPNVIFSGGNPLLDWEELINITKYFKQNHSDTKIKVNTNGFGFNKKVAEEAKELGISFCFSIFAVNEKEYVDITGNRNLYENVNNAIIMCREYGIIYSINMVVSPKSKNNLQKFYDFAFSLGGETIFTNEMLAKNEKKECIVSLPTDSSRIENIGPKDFYMRNKYNFCLNGNVAIASNGAILPCPSWQTDIGNIFTDKDLFHVFRKGIINLYWESPKSSIPVCMNCENRFACVDCSLLEWEMHKDKSIQRIFCDYSPELGLWHRRKELV